MASIKRFEDLDSWKKARNLVKMIYTESFKGELSKDYDTRSQYRRAALSIMNNIAEGFARRSNKDFIRFLTYSDSSAAELKSMTYVLEDIEYINQQTLNEIHLRIDETRKLILGLIRYLVKKSGSYVNEESLLYNLDDPSFNKNSNPTN